MIGQAPCLSEQRMCHSASMQPATLHHRMPYLAVCEGVPYACVCLPCAPALQVGDSVENVAEYVMDALISWGSVCCSYMMLHSIQPP